MRKTKFMSALVTVALSAALGAVPLSAAYADTIPAGGDEADLAAVMAPVDNDTPDTIEQTTPDAVTDTTEDTDEEAGVAIQADAIPADPDFEVVNDSTEPGIISAHGSGSISTSAEGIQHNMVSVNVQVATDLGVSADDLKDKTIVIYCNGKTMPGIIKTTFTGSSVVCLSLDALSYFGIPFDLEYDAMGEVVGYDFEPTTVSFTIIDTEGQVLRVAYLTCMDPNNNVILRDERWIPLDATSVTAPQIDGYEYVGQSLVDESKFIFVLDYQPTIPDEMIPQTTLAQTGDDTAVAVALLMFNIALCGLLIYCAKRRMA